MSNSTRQFNLITKLLVDRSELKKYLLEALRTHLELPLKYTPDLIDLNLPYLFAKDEDSAVDWIRKLETEFNLDIPDNEADLFFFSRIDEMVNTILKHSSLKNHRTLIGPPT